MVRSLREGAEPLRTRKKAFKHQRAAVSNQIRSARVAAMERSPPGSPSAAESSDYEPSLALPEEPYSPTDSGAEEYLDEEMGAGSLGAAELEWTEAPEQDSGAEEQLPDPEAAFSPSPAADREEDSGDSEDDEADSEEEPAPKRRRQRLRKQDS